MVASYQDSSRHPLGRTTVSRIGYGAMQLSGDGVFGPPTTDRSESLAVLRAAVDGRRRPYRHRAVVGLVPAEYSSGNSRVQGSITKAGNTHVRRLLIEAAWHHRKSYRTSGPTMRARWAKVEPALRARGHAGNRRLNQRWRRFTDRGKNPLVANVAIARELAGGCWSLATMR